jgi:hypothetical protein
MSFPSYQQSNREILFPTYINLKNRTESISDCHIGAQLDLQIRVIFNKKEKTFMLGTCQFDKEKRNDK